MFPIPWFLGPRFNAAGLTAVPSLTILFVLLSIRLAMVKTQAPCRWTLGPLGDRCPQFVGGLTLQLFRLTQSALANGTLCLFTLIPGRPGRANYRAPVLVLKWVPMSLVPSVLYRSIVLSKPATAIPNGPSIVTLCVAAPLNDR